MYISKWYDLEEDESLLPKLNYTNTPYGLVYDEDNETSDEEE
mgnify:CR=1 FL=1